MTNISVQLKDIPETLAVHVAETVRGAVHELGGHAYGNPLRPGTVAASLEDGSLERFQRKSANSVGPRFTVKYNHPVMTVAHTL